MTHRIVDSWRDCVVTCSCGWQGAERTMKAARAAWREHRDSQHGGDARMTLARQTAPSGRPGWTRKMPHAPDCPKENLHTLQPAGYLHWHEWAEKHMQTHAQLVCDGCGLYAIWVKKAAS